MAKMNINKPTSVEAFNLVSAFLENGNTYVILDSEKMGSMGLPIIYISKYTDKLEKISDETEWQNVKNYLKGIISGTSFHYVKIPESVNADEVYYTPLTLPQVSFDMIKSRYVVTESGGESVVLEPATNNDVINSQPDAIPEVKPQEILNVPNVEDAIQPAPEVPSAINNDVIPQVAPVAPVMPEAVAESNMSSTIDMVSSSPVVEPIVTENVPVDPSPIVEPNVTSSLEGTFLKDKETFLKACENMFDALVSKYEKQLKDVERREQEVLRKEQEIDSKLKNANEHLANAEAREQVANIAHDNAQKVMDFSNFMPINPNGNQTGVI